MKVNKECPFCGGKEVRVTDQQAYNQAKSGAICITCKGCSTDVWYFGDWDDSYVDNTRNAIAKWNKRFKAWDEP